MKLDLDPEKQSIIDRVRALARDKFAPRAAHHDRTASFPREDFDDLFHAGLLAPVAPKEQGGLGIGSRHGDAFTLWMMTKELAKADLSLARCWEGHINSLMLIDALGTDAQKERWLSGVVRKGHLWVAWSGEPQSRSPGQTARFGTTVERVEGGYVVRGSKVFSTSAGGAEWAILLVNTAGPGGARHASGSPETLLLLACDLSHPSIEIDRSFWEPIGMRATVSHLVKFHDTFIPADHEIGAPGQYLRDGWQTAFTPHYTASFLGAAEAAYEYAVECVNSQGKGGDPYVQQRVAQMSMNIDTAHLWLKHVASLWNADRVEEAQLAGVRARHVIEHLAQETVEHCVRTCGARSLIQPSPVERIYRDLCFYIRHDNDDHILATIGKSLLGKSFDPSFYNP